MRRTFQLKNWFTGSILRKLTFFVVLVCLILIILFWLFAVQLLEPVYNLSLHRDLERTLDVFVSVLDEAAVNDTPLTGYYLTESGVVQSLSPESIGLLNAEIEKGRLNIDDVCIDISNTKLSNVFLQENSSSFCVLHNSSGMLGEQAGPNNDLVRSVRSEVFSYGSCDHIIDMQMVMGKTTENGEVAVVLSSGLERVPQATEVLKNLMLPVGFLMVAMAILLAWVFSFWFTMPLRRLSSATKEITKGNYDARVQVKGSDEIAHLSTDFNHMAEQVQQSYESQRDLYANVSHDLRTPLTLIKGYAETLRDLTGDNPEKRKEQLNVIVDESDRLSLLVNNVLELSRMSSGAEKYNPVCFDLTQLCEEVGERYDAAGVQENYHFVFEGAEPLDIMSDPVLLQRALHNLLGNALKHIGEDGYIGLKVYKTKENRARVEVIDHGVGINENDLPHLFDKYYRSRADAGKPGTGLGLSITKAIFTTAGFSYGVESKQGEGAMFWFETALIEKPCKDKWQPQK